MPPLYPPKGDALKDYRDQLHTLPTAQLLHDREYWAWELVALEDAIYVDHEHNSKDFYRFKLDEIDRILAYRDRLRDHHPQIDWPEAAAPDKERWAEIKAALDLAMTVRYHVPNVAFTRSGRRLKCHCPFPWHDDSEPSFTLFPDQHWFCFGCGIGGDVYTFVMTLYQLSFLQAVEQLAKEAGLAPAPPPAPASKQVVIHRDGEDRVL